MQKQLNQLIEFHTKFNVPYRTEPGELNIDEIEMRMKLMQEELAEWDHAAQFEPLPNQAKELADKLYILLGTIITSGFQDVIEQVFDEVHASNMSKLGDDGKPVLRKDGKVMKGQNYKAPDLLWIEEM